MQRGLFEIVSVGRKNLPAGHFFPQHFDGSHGGELAPKTRVMLGGGGEPYAVVFSFAGLVAEDEDDLFLNIDGEASEHGPGAGREGGDCLEYKFVRDGLAAFDGEGGSVEREGRIEAGCFHPNYGLPSSAAKAAFKTRRLSQR
jgi:hypothetical protein